MMRVYISGPMSGIPNENRAAFEDAEKAMRKRFEWVDSFSIVNPVQIGSALRDRFKDMYSSSGKTEKPGWCDYMREDIPALCSCHAVLMLPGWQESDGAQIERYIATKLKMPVFENLNDMEIMLTRIFNHNYLQEE
jgi:hypothetical protein